MSGMTEEANRQSIYLSCVKQDGVSVLEEHVDFNPRSWILQQVKHTFELSNIWWSFKRSFAGSDKKPSIASSMLSTSLLSDSEEAVYGVDICQNDDSLVRAERVENQVGIHLQGVSSGSDTPVSTMPLVSDVFVSTTGWYLDEIEAIQLIFEMDERDLTDLHRVVQGNPHGKVFIRVLIDQWVQSHVAARAVDTSGSSVIYGYNSGVTILGWEVVSAKSMSGSCV